MNKSQLVDFVASKADISKAKAGSTIDAVIHAISNTLVKGDTVTLVGFGSFSTVKRAARVGRNPKTGKEIKIAETVTPKFRAGKALKEAVAGSKKKRK